MSMQPMVHDVWPQGEEHLRPVVTTCYLISVAVLSALLSRRWLGWHQLKRLPIAKLMVLAVLGDSLLFVFASAVLVLGVGTSFSEVACKIGIWWCIILYASSKVLIYSFLSEKLYAVYSVTPTRRIPRWQSTQYKIAMGFLVLWLGVAVVMIVGRIAEIREHDDACVIGLKLYATVPMLTVDAVVNIYLTVAFVLPVYRSRWHKAQTLALHSCIAAVASLVTSFGNILILSIQHGHQLSWVCLGSCGLDVSINAIILYIVTSSSSSSHNSLEDYAVGHNNKAATSHVRSTGIGASGVVPTMTMTSKTAHVSTAGSFATAPPPLRPHDVGSSATFASDYSLEPKVDLDARTDDHDNDDEGGPAGGGRGVKFDRASPSAPPSPRAGGRTSRTPKPSSPDRRRTGTARCGHVVEGIYVCEEVVRVEETGLSPDELREEEEWFKRGRQSRGGSGSASASGTGSGAPSRNGSGLVGIGVSDVLPTVDYRS